MLTSWEDRYRLTATECDVLAQAALGLTLLQIASNRGTQVATLRKQSKALLQKTFDDSLAFAAIRLLLEAAGLP